MPGSSGVSGWPIPLDSDAFGNLAQSVRDLVDAIEAGWSTYTPVLTNLSIGNGVITARYKKIGKTTFVRLEITGGTTTSGSGALSISLPVAARAGSAQWVGGGYYSSGAGATGIAALFLTSASATAGLFAGAPAAAITALGNTGVFRVNGVYEAN